MTNSVGDSSGNDTFGSTPVSAGSLASMESDVFDEPSLPHEAINIVDITARASNEREVRNDIPDTLAGLGQPIGFATTHFSTGLAVNKWPYFF